MAPQLISTIQEVQACVPVNMTSDFDVVAPFLRSAESMYVQRIIGTAQFNAIVAYYEGNVPLTPNQAEALALCQKVIANIGYFLAVPVLNVQIGSSGIQIFSNTDTKTAFQWQVEDLKTALIELGFSAIEDLLNFLIVNPDDFALFIASPQYQAQLACLITTAVQFSGFFDIGNSRFVFQSINYIMNRVEQQNIVKLVGAPFLASLKAADINNYQTILVNTYLAPGIALITIAKAIIERVVVMKNGVVSFNFKGRSGNMNESVAVTPEQIAATSDQLITDGSNFIQDGMQYISDNIGNFPGFVPTTSRRRFQVTNSPWSGVFGN